MLNLLCQLRSVKLSVDFNTGGYSIEPVSYTHLDVYKRQDYLLSKAFFPQQLTLFLKPTKKKEFLLRTRIKTKGATMKDDVEIVIAICAGDIEKSKKRGDLGISYDDDVLRLPMG